MNVGIISLGCAKNRVDSETIAYLFKDNQVKIVNDIDQSNIIIVNTCGFIDSSKQESIDTILEMAKYHKILIVTGCLVERYKEELKKEIPEVDLFISIKDYPHFSELLNEVIKQRQFKGELSFSKRVLSTPSYTAFLKISEGCNNRCTYCAIPLIRGGFRSYKMEDLILQAKDIAKQNVKELVVISQDTTRYGEDLKDVNIVTLLKELLKIPEFDYIRLLYLYPDEISDELIDLIGSEERLTPYFDIPVQHASNKILQAMHRRGDHDYLINLFKKIRQRVPNAILRTTLIVGFPGETEEDFQILCDFVKEVKFDHLGAFTYSREEGTLSCDMPDQVLKKTKDKRYRKIMSIQKKISLENNKKRIGQVSNGIIIGYDEDIYCYKIRSGFNAPDDIDGSIFVYYDGELTLGQKVKFEIIDADAYDLYAKLIIE